MGVVGGHEDHVDDPEHPKPAFCHLVVAGDEPDDADPGAPELVHRLVVQPAEAGCDDGHPGGPGRRGRQQVGEVDAAADDLDPCGRPVQCGQHRLFRRRSFEGQQDGDTARGHEPGGRRTRSIAPSCAAWTRAAT